ncbi:MAG: HNH endonuclease [Ktedonobacteraceae bacterium]
MRPVRKGNRTSYNPDTSPTATQRIIDLQSYIDLIRTSARAATDFKKILDQEIVDNAIAYNEKAANIYIPKTFLVPTDLLTEITTLRNAFAQALQQGVAITVLLDIVQRLNFALWLASEAYDSISRDVIEGVYKSARYDLITNIGQYCSYCEMPLAASLAVEHKLPKQWFPFQALNWENFLLACPICNSNKNSKPGVVEGIETALAGHVAPPLTKEKIAASASSLYQWPDDETSYTSFEKAFQYKMYKVLYNLSGKVYKERKFSNNELHEAVRRSLIRKIDQAGGHIRAEVQTLLFDIKPLLEESDLLSYLRQVDPGGVGVTFSGPNYSAQLEVLKDRFKNFTNNSVANYLKFRMDIQIADNVTITTLGANQWSLTQTSVYYVDVGDRIKLFLDSDRTSLFGDWKKGVAAMRSALAGGSLPEEIAKLINQDSFGVTLDIIPQDGNRPSIMKVTRKYILTYTHGTLDVLASEVFSVELRLATAGTRSPISGSVTYNPKSSRVIEDVGLNKHDINDQKLSDRRVARRTNAWFTAIECYKNLLQAELITDSPGVVLSLLEMIAQTASFTGFWSVWRWVALTYLGERRSPQVITALNQPAYFPGTR